MNGSPHGPVGRSLTRGLTRGLAFLVCLWSAGVAAHAQEVAVEDIAAEFERRGRAVRSAKVVWEETQTYPKDSIEDPDTLATYPAEDTTVKRQVTLWLEDSKWNCTSQGKIWAHDVERFVNQRCVFASNGRSSRSFITDNDTMPCPFGSELHNHQSRKITTVELMPLMWSFRATDPMRESWRFVPKQWSVSSPREETNGVDCVVLKRKYERRRVDYLAFAPGQGFSLIQYRRLDKGRLTVQIDVRHSQDDAHGWVPAAWKVTHVRNDGMLDWLISGKVKQIEINLAIDPQTFDPPFPVGTVFLDERTNRQYLVLEGGGKRPVAFINDTIVPSDDDSPSAAFSFWKWIAGIAVVLVFLTVVVRRARAGIR